MSVPAAAERVLDDWIKVLFMEPPEEREILGILFLSNRAVVFEFFQNGTSVRKQELVPNEPLIWDVHSTTPCPVARDLNELRVTNPTDSAAVIELECWWR